MSYRFRLDAIVEPDDMLCDMNDPEERERAWRLLASLILHSTEVGDTIGTVVFVRTTE